MGQQIEAVLLDNPELESVYTIAGIRGEPNKGQIYVKLKDNRDSSTSQVQTQVRQNLPKIPR